MYGEDLDLEGQPMDYYLLGVPGGTMMDGAVVELARDDRRLITAELRIPAHQDG